MQNSYNGAEEYENTQEDDEAQVVKSRRRSQEEAEAEEDVHGTRTHDHHH